jgi:transposase
MKSNYEQSKFIKVLEEVPFLSYAAKKTGIARSTIYRWRKSNPKFREQLEKALGSGREQLNDIAEMALVEKIKSKDMGAIKFFLQHNNEKYRTMRTTFVSIPEEKIKNQDSRWINPKHDYSNLSDEGLDEMIEYLENEIK